jgi:hypothetical protein
MQAGAASGSTSNSDREDMVTSTPWSSAVPQGASKTPPAYSWKGRSSAWIATLTGWCAAACGKTPCSHQTETNFAGHLTKLLSYKGCTVRPP